MDTSTKTEAASSTLYLVRQIEPTRKDSAYRLVGYYEYGNALDRFDRLFNTASEDELRVADEIIYGHDEFTVYTNLSRRMTIQPSTLNEVGLEGDDFKRQGLAWLAALARVELGAIAAGFTPLEKPFEAARPSRYELSPYLEVLADGMRTHYWSLRADPKAQNFRRAGLREQQAIAYTRRIYVAQQFLESFRRAADPQLSPAQRRELKQWESYLYDQQATLVEDVLKLYLAAYTNTSTSTVKIVHEDGLEATGLPYCAQGAIRHQVTAGTLGLRQISEDPSPTPPPPAGTPR